MNWSKISLTFKVFSFLIIFIVVTSSYLLSFIPLIILLSIACFALYKKNQKFKEKFDALISKKIKYVFFNLKSLNKKILEKEHTYISLYKNEGFKTFKDSLFKSEKRYLIKTSAFIFILIVVSMIISPDNSSELSKNTSRRGYDSVELTEREKDNCYDSEELSIRNCLSQYGTTLRSCSRANEGVAKSCMLKTKNLKIKKLEIKKIKEEFNPKDIF